VCNSRYLKVYKRRLSVSACRDFVCRVGERLLLWSAEELAIYSRSPLKVGHSGESKAWEREDTRLCV